ncbi:MAG: hypothetical protein LBH16_12320 [Treponema sp.]|jgi:hypothetical protein|nr:hypothetical protein [Treponema sp.]
MQAIPNIYESALKPVTKMKARAVSLDYAYSDNACEIDTGIRETIKGVRLSILAMGMGLAKIKKKGLYTDLDCKSMAAYIQKLCDETKMDRSSIFNWLYIGEAYIKYRNDLVKIGFSDDDGPTKLPYLERALETNRKQEVFKNIKDMSLREFINFSKGESEEEDEEKNSKKVTIRDNEVYIGGKQAIHLSENLDSRTYNYFKKIILIAGKAMEENEVVLPVRLYDMDELKRFERAANKIKKEMREET